MAMASAELTATTSMARPRNAMPRSITRHAAIKTSTSQTLDQIALRRLYTFDQIRNAHEGDASLYLDMVRVDPDQIARQKSTKHLSVDELFVLGLSCSRLLQIKPGADLARAVAHLLEEFDARFVSHRDALPMSLPRPVEGREPLNGAPAQAPNKPGVVKFGKKVVYEYLVQTNIVRR